MKIEFNRTGAERKELVMAIGKALDLKPKYMGVPSTAYMIGQFIVDKNGGVTAEDGEALERLVRTLIGDGFLPAETEKKDSAEESPMVEETGPQGESRGLTVAIPLDKVGVGNLTNLLEAKGNLIRKALGVEDIRIAVDEEKVSFPWFSEVPDAETAAAYSRFISALCEMSVKQKRITAKEKEVDNEKYAFRCFLLRLGFIGAEYKADRKILLKNLDGSSAFKNGAKKEAAEHEISE